MVCVVEGQCCACASHLAFPSTTPWFQRCRKPPRPTPFLLLTCPHSLCTLTALVLSAVSCAVSGVWGLSPSRRGSNVCSMVCVHTCVGSITVRPRECFATYVRTYIRNTVHKSLPIKGNLVCTLTRWGPTALMPLECNALGWAIHIQYTTTNSTLSCRQTLHDFSSYLRIAICIRLDIRLDHMFPDG